MYLEQNNLLHSYQGACRGKSIEEILLLAVDHIATLLDKGNVVCAALIDLRKAFDSLDHCFLLQRISELGVHCEVLEWFLWTICLIAIIGLKQLVLFQHEDL